MSEQELLDSVIDLGHLFGWRIAHFRPARTRQGWRTPVSADGKGWPDLTLLRANRLVMAELKSSTGKLTTEQTEWIEALSHVAEVHVWRPSDWQDGTIEETLR